MKIKIKEIGVGLHPSEKVVEVSTSEGAARLVVDVSSISNNQLDVGFPLAQKGGNSLVELPREAFNGSWRVWVSNSDLVEDAA